MAEEQQEQQGGGTSIKQILIGLVSTITLGVGGWFTTKLTGGKEEEKPAAAAAPVINITNSNAQQQAVGKTVVINKTTEAKPAEAKPATPVKKKEGDEFKEKPAQW